MPKKLMREHKSSLFATMLSEKENQLKVYNYLNNSDYTNPDEIEVTTIEEILFIGRKNDASFILDNVMNLYEHQSTYNPNMPLRGLFYFSELYENYIIKHKLNIYGTKLLQIPTPKYVIFYKGSMPAETVTELKLSDLFIRKDIEPDIEVRATMICLNETANVKKCEPLYGFALYNDKFVEYNETMEAEKAALKAIEYCIDNGVMADFFMRKKAECMGSILRDYSEEEIWKMIGNDYYEDGKARGIESGIKSTVEVCKECDIPKETIIIKIAEKYSLTEEEAAAKVEQYL